MLGGTLWCLHEDTLTLVYERNPGAEFYFLIEAWAIFSRMHKLCYAKTAEIFQPQNRKKSASVNFISYIHVEYCPTLLAQWTQNLVTNREEGDKNWVKSSSE